MPGENWRQGKEGSFGAMGGGLEMTLVGGRERQRLKPHRAVGWDVVAKATTHKELAPLICQI
jgi:hypothetical protein